MSSHPENNISHWLESLGLGEYADAFASNHITLETLRELTDADLKECGVAALGHRKLLLKAIGKLGEISPPAEKTETVAKPLAPPQPAPRAPQPPPVSASAAQAQAPADSTSAAPSRRRFWAKILASKFLLVSIIVHLLFGLGATYFIVQRYSAARKLTFQGGPPTTNPAKRALEHQVSVAKKKAGGAPPQARRISTSGLAKIVLPDMPVMTTSTHVVPGMMSGIGGMGTGRGLGAGGGMGSGGSGGGGGGGMTLFGFQRGEGLPGHFYDLKQSRDRKPVPVNVETFHAALADCLARGGDDGALAAFFKAPTTLYAPQLFTPSILASEGPKAFGVARDVPQPGYICVVYKGRVTAPESGQFRFVGMGDNVLAVRFAGRIVLDNGSLNIGGPKPAAGYHYKLKWAEQAMGDGYYAGAVVGHGQGETFDVQAGETYDIAIIWGELDGGLSLAQLLLEKIGENYSKDAHGNPKLPIFRMGNASMPHGLGLPPTAIAGRVWKVAGGSGSLLK